MLHQTGSVSTRKQTQSVYEPSFEPTFFYRSVDVHVMYTLQGGLLADVYPQPFENEKNSKSTVTFRQLAYS